MSELILNTILLFGLIFMFVVYQFFNWLDRKQSNESIDAFGKVKSGKYEVNILTQGFGNVECLVDGHDWYYIDKNHVVCRSCGRELKKVRK